jgi:1-acyl-sn-glycerol-3-phosphate acyltransferase
MQDLELRLEPYRDEEVKAAIQELFSYSSFTDGMKAFLPEQLNTLFLQIKNNIETAFDFQKNIIAPFLKLIEKISITSLSSSGLEQLDPKEKYLFISNHRDIVLDSAFLNMVLFEHGFQTSQIAIGDNLMVHRISELLFRLNKSFVVRRKGTPRELYTYSLQLSNYIRDLITSKKDAVWIAQREGRAKDGNDRTQVGLLTMLSLSGKNDLKKHFQEVKIVPVAISYEFDPCGLLKTQEYLHLQNDPNYAKSFQKDVENMLTGIKGPKGRVHFHFGKPLAEELNALDELPNSKKQLEAVAAMIDQSIHLNYKLHPVNYVAYDLLRGGAHFSSQYAPQEHEQLSIFFENQLKALKPLEQEAGRKYLLEMYANPLVNALSYQ